MQTTFHLDNSKFQMPPMIFFITNMKWNFELHFSGYTVYSISASSVSVDFCCIECSGDVIDHYTPDSPERGMNNYEFKQQYTSIQPLKAHSPIHSPTPLKRVETFALAWRCLGGYRAWNYKCFTSCRFRCSNLF